MYTELGSPFIFWVVVSDCGYFHDFQECLLWQRMSPIFPKCVFPDVRCLPNSQGVYAPTWNSSLLFHVFLPGPEMSPLNCLLFNLCVSTLTQGASLIFQTHLHWPRMSPLFPTGVLSDMTDLPNLDVCTLTWDFLIHGCVYFTWVVSVIALVLLFCPGMSP